MADGYGRWKMDAVPLAIDRMPSVLRVGCELPPAFRRAPLQKFKRAGELAVAGPAQSPLGGPGESENEVIAVDDFAPVRQWVLVRDPVERLRQGDRDPVGGQTAEGRAREGNPVLPGDRQGQEPHQEELVDLRYQGRGTRSEPRTRRGTFYKRQRDEVVSRARVAEACSGSDDKIGRAL